mmetsp:Transcript_765/g.1963  ORF Transcript_765/g.1963 Transcript_765/m.1963 type:complete len:221 (+) Transcript_765:1-663(+)
MRTRTCSPPAGRCAPPPCPLPAAADADAAGTAGTAGTLACCALDLAAPRDAAAAVLLGVASLRPLQSRRLPRRVPRRPVLAPASRLLPPAARASLCCASVRAGGQAGRVARRRRGGAQVHHLLQAKDPHAVRTHARDGAGRSFVYPPTAHVAQRGVSRLPSRCAVAVCSLLASKSRRRHRRTATSPPPPSESANAHPPPPPPPSPPDLRPSLVWEARDTN